MTGTLFPTDDVPADGEAQADDVPAETSAEHDGPPPLAPRTLAQVAEIAADPPSDAALGVFGPAHAETASLLARGLAPDGDDAEAAAAVVEVWPSAMRWRRADLDEHVIPAARRSSRWRNVVVLHDADRLGPVADRLLKTVEEPPGPTWFLLAAPAADLLPVTLRGRISVTVSADPADAAVRTARLEVAGVDTDTASRIVALAGEQLTLDQVCAAHPEAAATVLSVLDALLPDGALAGGQAAAAIDAIAGHSPTAARATVRAHLAHLLASRWASLLARQARLAGSREELRQVEHRLRVCDELHTWLNRNIPPASALAAAAAALADEPPQAETAA